MNENFLEDIINFYFWQLTIRDFPQSVKAIYSDHTYQFYKGSYFTRVYLKDVVASCDDLEKMKVEQSIRYMVMKLTGLPTEKIKIQFYNDEDLVIIG
jgi:hypothetical protein